MALIGDLNQQIDGTLAPILGPGDRCVLLDFPAHGNVGDSAIWLGERAWLERRGVEITYVCDRTTFSKSAVADAVGTGTILLHGGGNFGDIWQPHQAFRQEVITSFPHNRIVQLPQTLHFQNPDELERARAIVNAHDHLLILCRDRESHAFARTHFRAQAVLCPDMAFQLGHIDPPGERGPGVVWLARTDPESAIGEMRRPTNGLEPTDWLTDTPTAVVAAAQHLQDRLRRDPSDRAAILEAPALYDAVARERVLRGCRTLAAGQVVVTDRLHGHILCELMGLPHVLLDNNYGKLRRFFQTWTWRSRLVRWASSVEHAATVAQRLAGRAATPPRWSEEVAGLGTHIDALVPSGRRFLLLDQDEYRTSLDVRGTPVPFPEREGTYWGPPAGDDDAIRDCDDMAKRGIEYAVVTRSAFWWLVHYPRFHRHLREHYRCVLENDLALIFDLRGPSAI